MHIIFPKKTVYAIIELYERRYQTVNQRISGMGHPSPFPRLFDIPAFPQEIRKAHVFVGMRRSGKHG